MILIHIMFHSLPRNSIQFPSSTELSADPDRWTKADGNCFAFSSNDELAALINLGDIGANWADVSAKRKTDLPFFLRTLWKLCTDHPGLKPKAPRKCSERCSDFCGAQGCSWNTALGALAPHDLHSTCFREAWIACHKKIAGLTEESKGACSDAWGTLLAVLHRPRGENAWSRIGSSQTCENRESLFVQIVHGNPGDWNQFSRFPSRTPWVVSKASVHCHLASRLTPQQAVARFRLQSPATEDCFPLYCHSVIAGWWVLGLQHGRPCRTDMGWLRLLYSNL